MADEKSERVIIQAWAILKADGYIAEGFPLYVGDVHFMIFDKRDEAEKHASSELLRVYNGPNLRVARIRTVEVVE